ncbi:SDR family NAD(P)-dependent oxidoreductase [Ornithinibacillus contaminans]|uniref:SDR family NAD(P)-dependent oxidoreductase n=1 Tax=Ornithinibacillus contaminans TaxID=694055 RepID=UPI00064DEC87|nr:SDR family oxidoreductase [Ornithinibacillus contaminans]
MQSRLNNKKVVITGASSGIGEALSKQLASEGVTPIMLARSLDKLRQLQKQITEEFAIEAFYYQIDLTNEQAIDTIVPQIINDHGQIHALVNNAGVGVFNYVHETDWDSIQQMINLNVLSLIRITKLFLPHFIANQEGHIINIASQAGKISTPKSAVYAATKHAVLGFTNAIRQELSQHNILVTAVNLGPVRTNFFLQADPEGRYQENVAKYMLDPKVVATQITKSLFTSKRELNMPLWMDVGSKLYQLFPSLMEMILKKQFNKK